MPILTSVPFGLTTRIVPVKPRVKCTLCPKSKNEKNVESTRSLGIAVIACNRLNYFQKSATALAAQTLNGNNVSVYIDNCTNSLKIINATKYILPKAQLYIQTKNVGIARLTWKAQNDIFENYNRLLLLEEDHLIGPNYINLIQEMLTGSDDIPSVGPVAGSYVTIINRSCEYIITRHDSTLNQNAHNIWAWGLTKAKWLQYAPFFKEMFENSHLNTDDYKKRSFTLITKEMKKKCPKEYHRWPGQDWLRACAFYLAKMPHKLTTSTRFLTYIGEIGMHSSKNSLKRKGFPQSELQSQIIKPVKNNTCKRIPLVF